MTKLGISFESDLRTVALREGSLLMRDHNQEYVTSIFYDGERLVRFWTARRDGDKIREFHYSISAETGIPHLDLVGKYEGNNRLEQYSELDKKLQEFEK